MFYINYPCASEGGILGCKGYRISNTLESICNQASVILITKIIPHLWGGVEGPQY